MALAQGFNGEHHDGRVEGQGRHVYMCKCAYNRVCVGGLWGVICHHYSTGTERQPSLFLIQTFTPTLTYSHTHTHTQAHARTRAIVFVIVADFSLPV